MIIESDMSCETRVAIFGASLSGNSAFSALYKQYNLVAYIDNDANKQGQVINGLSVHSPSDIECLDLSKVLIASEFFEQVIEQLKRIAPDLPYEVLPARIIKPLELQHSHRAGQTALDILKLLSGHLHHHCLEHYVDAGTLLGIYRDNALIPWDDDLDFAIKGCSVEEAIRVIEWVLPELMTLTGVEWQLTHYINHQSYGCVPVGGIRALKLTPKEGMEHFPGVDFFVKYIEGENMDYCLSSRGFRMPSSHFSSTPLYPFNGSYVSIPHDAESYLERHYGDWKTPKRDWTLAELKNTTVF